MATLKPGDDGYEEVRAAYIVTEVEKARANALVSIESELDRRYKEFMANKEERYREAAAKREEVNGRIADLKVIENGYTQELTPYYNRG